MTVTEDIRTERWTRSTAVKERVDPDHRDAPVRERVDPKYVVIYFVS